MALTKIITDGITDDAVTSGKIPANAVGTSEIADDAVTAAKIADGAIDNSAKIGGNVINNTHMADNAINTAEITDQAVTLAKLPHGTSSNDGKFLRANNGADPSFETVTSTTINNNADNKVITGSGTANTLNAESNVVIDSSGRLLLGHSSTRPIAGNTDRTIQIEATDAKASLSITRNSANTGGPFLSLGKSRATSVGGTTIVNNGDFLGTISFAGADGTDLITRGADIIAQVDGTPGSDDMPGRLIFSTTSDGANSPTERMRLDKVGNVFIGKTVTALTSDGIRADGSGMITVSRTSTSTVGGTANGASLVLCNPSATDNNFSNVGFYKADGLVTSQINGITVSQSSRHGALSFLTHDGTVLSEKMNIDQNGDIVIGADSWSYKKALNVQGSTGAILALSNYDTTTYAADTHTGIELRVNTGDTGNQNGSCEIRAFKENGTNGNNARGLGFYTAGNGSSPAERLRIHPGGEVTVPAGITFGTAITANDAANTLDDYEEGTFSAHGHDSGGTQFSTGLTGKYTKIGNRVHLSIFFFAYGGTSNKTMGYFTNLPFAGVSEPHATGVIVRTSGGNNVNIEHEESCYLSQGGTQIRMKGNYGTGSSKNNTLSLTYLTTA